METRYYSCNGREDLMKVILFEDGYFENENIVVDVIGIVNLNPPIDLEEDEKDTREPDWSDFLFNVRFKNDKTEVRETFAIFKEEKPKSPVRKFL